MNALLPGLERRNLGREVLAGVTLIAIAVPLNIGYAQIAGLPATAGLYALVVPTLVWAIASSSRQLVVSPDAAAASLVASSIGGLAAAGSQGYATMALAQAIICGGVFLLMSVFKLGFLADFLSKPILIGFVGGLSLDILVSQVSKMLGVHLDPGTEFLDKLTGLVSGIGATNPWSALIAAAAVTLLLAGRQLAPAVPWALVALVSTTVVVALTDAGAAGVTVLGEIPAGPPVLTWPMLDWAQWLALVPSALALTMVASAEGLLVARSYGEKRGYPTRPNRDLLALGAASVAAGASGSFAMGASTSRTAAMDQLGSRTQLPSLVLAIGTLALLLFGTGLLAEIPSPAIGAIVAVAVLPLLGLREFRGLWRLSRFEFWIGATCFAVTLLVGAIAGILVAFVLALINLARRAAQPAIDVLAQDDNPADSLLEDAPTGHMTADGTIVVRMAAPLFFANGAVFVRAVKVAITRVGGASSVRHLVIDMEAVTDVDVTGAEAFAGLREWLERAGISLAFSRVRPGARGRLEHFEIVQPTDIVFDTNRAAVAAFRPRL
ncbi:SulP family inorganic anion transporter [Leucobacter luti]|uniref:SulP family inorganic anion transporter n=1 Tax=Leucobacter luti TaxID=340320 RepID=UPI001C68A878|nr:SulP family inorganic anion transporter [Leucobacter luti]QYM76845.1 STAS domain-containing protein [Leucobacter luti]